MMNIDHSQFNHHIAEMAWDGPWTSKKIAKWKPLLVTADSDPHVIDTEKTVHQFAQIIASFADNQSHVRYVSLLKVIHKLGRYSLIHLQPNPTESTSAHKIYALASKYHPPPIPHSNQHWEGSFVSALINQDDAAVASIIKSLSLREGNHLFLLHLNRLCDYLKEKAKKDQKEAYTLVFDWIHNCLKNNLFQDDKDNDLLLYGLQYSLRENHRSATVAFDILLHPAGRKNYQRSILFDNPFLEERDYQAQLLPEEEYKFVYEGLFTACYFRVGDQVFRSYFTSDYSKKISEAKLLAGSRDFFIRKLKRDPTTKQNPPVSEEPPPPLPCKSYALSPTVEQVAWMFEHRPDLLKYCNNSFATECKITLAIQRYRFSQELILDRFTQLVDPFKQWECIPATLDKRTATIKDYPYWVALLKNVEIKSLGKLAPLALSVSILSCDMETTKTLIQAYPEALKNKRPIKTAIGLGYLKLAKQLIYLGCQLTGAKQFSALVKLTSEYVFPSNPQNQLICERYKEKIVDFAAFLHHHLSLQAEGYIQLTLEEAPIISSLESSPVNQTLEAMRPFLTLFKNLKELTQVIKLSIEAPDLCLSLIRAALKVEGLPIIEALNSDPKTNPVVTAIQQGHCRVALELVKLGVDVPGKREAVRECGSHRVVETVSLLQDLIQSIQKKEKETPAFTATTYEEILACLDLLLNTIEADQQMPTATRGEVSCSVVETCYLTHTPNRELYRQMTLKLLEAGAKITHRMFIEMKWELLLEKEDRFAPHLVAQGYLSAEQVAAIHTVQTKAQASEQELLQKLLTAAHQLEHGVNPIHLPYEKIVSFRKLKKEVKTALPLLQDSSVVLEIYQNFVRAYDALVSNHLVLRTLRKISTEMRRPAADQPPSKRLCTSYSLFGPHETYSQTETKQRIGKVFGTCRPAIWEGIYARVTAAGETVQREPVLSLRPIVWTHGLRSPSIPSIVASGALMPMGMLLKEGVVPFSGEICGSDETHNDERLSGESLSGHFGDGSWIFESNTRLLVSWLYALKNNGYGENEKSFDPQASWGRLTIDNLDLLMKKERPSGNWSVFRVDILRLRLTDPQAHQKLAAFQEAVRSHLETSSSCRKQLQNLYHALTLKLSYTLSPQDVQMMEHPYPVLFASTTIDTEFWFNNQDMAVGKQRLGEFQDIQIAFTLPDHITDLQQRLAPFNIKVFDFEVARYLELMCMIRGSENQELEAAKAGTQEMIARLLQRDLLPLYMLPYPEKPSYVDERTLTRISLERPYYHSQKSSYDTYIAAVSSGEILPREIHGPLHAARTALWSQLLLTLYLKEFPEAKEINPLWLGLTAAAHDIARQDDGRDYWDPESARFLKGYLQQMRVDQKKIPFYVQAIADKDPEGDLFSSPVQEIVHDADVLEILRCLRDFQQFKKEKLCFDRFTTLTEEFKLQLIKEVYAFILKTEDPAIKRSFERDNTNYYDRLRELLKANAAEFPLLASL